MLYALLGSALAAYGVLVGGLYVFQRHLLYFPDAGRPELGDLAALGVREITLKTADGLSLLSWYLPPRDGHPVIAYFHGNGGHIGYRAERLRWFARNGYGVLMAEYRGYGGNPGTPSESGLVADGAAALDFLGGEGIAPNRLVIYGESLGSGVAVPLAAQREVASLILEAPFTSVAEVAQYHYSFIPASALVRDRFELAGEDRRCQGADPGPSWRARPGRPASLWPSAVRRSTGTQGAVALPRGRSRGSRPVWRIRGGPRLFAAASRQCISYENAQDLALWTV